MRALPLINSEKCRETPFICLRKPFTAMIIDKLYIRLIYTYLKKCLNVDIYGRFIGNSLVPKENNQAKERSGDKTIFEPLTEIMIIMFQALEESTKIGELFHLDNMKEGITAFP